MSRKIKSLMALYGIKGTDIAKKLGLSRVTISIVITGKGKSRRVQKAIALALDMPVEELWPENDKKAA